MTRSHPSMMDMTDHDTQRCVVEFAFVFFVLFVWARRCIMISRT